jgi:glycosidase
LIQLRKKYPVFTDGDFQLLCPDDQEIFAYIRQNGEEQLLVVCNFSAKQRDFCIPEEFAQADALISNYPVGVCGLRPYEAFIRYQKKGA